MNGVDAASWLETNLDTSLLIICLDCLAHHVSSLWSCRNLLFTCRGLDVIRTCIHGKNRSLHDVAAVLQIACFQDALHLVLTAGCLQLLDIVAETFVILAEELAYRHNDIYLCSAILDSHGCLGNLYLDKCLGRWEITAYNGDFYAINLQTLTDKTSEVRVGAYGCNVRKFRIILGKLIYFLNHSQDAFFCIFCMKRSQFDATEEEFLHLHGFVFCYLLVKNLLYFCCYFLVVEVAVILFQDR